MAIAVENATFINQKVTTNDEEATINEFFQQAGNALAKEGKSAAIDMLKSHLNNWKKQHVSIAVTGSSNSGKSTFINRIRGLKDTDEKAAKTDVIECTTVPEDYPDPQNDLIVYTDLPGVGTERNPRNESYLQRMKFERYDAFLILSQSRFSEDDRWLADQITKLRKPFFFVKTKIDLQISSNKLRKNIPEESTKATIRKNIESNLNATSEEKKSNIYLISNKQIYQHEFPRLVNDITSSLPLIKQDALTFSLQSFSIEIVEQKIRRLEYRATMVATASAACAAVPIPGLSIAVDMGLIVEEFIHYRKQLGLHIKKNHVENSEKTTKEKIQAKLAEISNSLSNEEARIKLLSTCGVEILKKLSFYFALNLLEEVSRIAVPVIGSAISAGISFYSTRTLLLNEIEELGDKEKAFFNTKSPSEIRSMLDKL